MNNHNMPSVAICNRHFRYLIFPELNECCLCCASDMGCGILSPSWLDGAEFQVGIRGVACSSYLCHFMPLLA